MKLDKINYPSALNKTQLQRKTFYSDREEAFLFASAPKNKFSLGIDYTVKKLGFGAHFTLLERSTKTWWSRAPIRFAEIRFTCSVFSEQWDLA